MKDEDINEKLRYDLLKRTLGPFRVDKHYNYYSIGASYLFVFNDIGDLLWQYDCGTEIIQSSVVGDFISIALANDKIVIIDLNS
ncbi:hypothetical protein [Fusibacter sp. JL216-2]|uniref:hypothetical protein n=1 Tax=Fusibacter sp. JL216-2 TaxID=3071453 RepID=UPI003D32C70E